jgi:hypothetical protein
MAASAGQSSPLRCHSNYMFLLGRTDRGQIGFMASTMLGQIVGGDSLMIWLRRRQLG